MPAQALTDTVLVLAIVAVTGTLLFGLNVVLADAGQWWYGS
jgi:preprotein translocase subunit SecE